MKKILVLMLAVTFMVSTVLTGCGKEADKVSDKDGDRYTAAAQTGTYIGHENDGVSEFLGISYADPIESFKAPKDVTTTSKDIIEAKEWGPSCIQPVDEVETASQWNQAEDCLDLNIWTKDVKKKEKPVMVFIHGGGAWQGGTYDTLYDGENFVRNLDEKEDVVMVTMNYRLGIFGSLNLSTLEGYEEDEYYDAVNLGLLDQKQALKWVHENIEAFGGDPENVTVFGQSAGGGAICTLMTMPDAKQYFQKAILESGQLFNRQISMEKSVSNSQKVFELMGVKSVDDLLKIKEADYKEKYIDDIFNTLDTPQRVADGKIVPLNGYQELKNGAAKDIDVMIGVTDGEYDFYATDWDNFPAPIKDPEYIKQKLFDAKEKAGDTATAWSPVDAPEVMAQYMQQDTDQVKRMMDLYNDSQYRQTSVYIAEALSQWNSNTYMYYWTWAPEPEAVIKAVSADNAEVSPFGRAMHCMDAIFVFGTLKDGYTTLSGPEDQMPKALMEKTQAAWFSFAKSGNPNNKLIPEWKAYNTDTRSTMVIDEEWKVVDDLRSEDRIILDQIRPTE